MGDLEQFEELLLRSARNGDVKTVEDILKARKDGKIDLEINCKGKTKSNQGWTPLHLASYFGHRDVAEVLLQNGASLDELNDAGDTPLHKAALTNREDVVLLLLEHGASVSTINGEGLRPGNLPRDSQLREPGAPNVNCVDALGNTSLHCAAYRGHIDVAVALLQNGCDPSIRNHSNQTAFDLGQTQQMQQVLKVQPVRSFQHSVTRFEGPLLRQMRILGWRMVWGVLERGVLTFFNSRADASSGVRRRDYKYLDNCKVVPMIGGDGAMFIIQYNDGTCHRLAATPDPLHPASINRQDALQTATAHQQLMEQQVEELMATLASLELDHSQQGEVHDVIKNGKHCVCNSPRSPTGHPASLPHYEASSELIDRSSGRTETTTYSTHRESEATTPRRFSLLAGTARNMTTSLTHFFSLMKQQEEVRELQLKEEREKVRVLEESLRVLATEHHDLEESIASHVSSNGSSIYNTPANSYVSLPRPRRFFDAVSDDEFFDAFSQDPQSPQSPTPHIPGIPSGPSTTPASSMNQGEGDTYTIPPLPSETAWDSANIEADGDVRVLAQNSSTGIGNIVSGSVASKTSGSSGMLGSVESYTKLSGSSHTQSSNSHTTSSLAVTPLVRTSDLSDHSDGSDETVTSESRRCSHTEEKSSFSLVSLGGTRYSSPYLGPRRCWRSWGR
ncbi:Oxysterol-binding protein-related protein 1 [Portunus trituberculatus]|uniref:Oxysterol-binding protein-related protein 1 n=1 Tax=Portunus trituberculatus TaxID=210409 RepID=A0A5B7ENX7_PORTR|nr:Oxysterol-binding protein-related protein 1 [Portunus trituberculatus]